MIEASTRETRETDHHNPRLGGQEGVHMEGTRILSGLTEPCMQGSSPGVHLSSTDD